MWFWVPRKEPPGGTIPAARRCMALTQLWVLLDEGLGGIG